MKMVGALSLWMTLSVPAPTSAIVPPDFSQAYFPELKRPHIEKVKTSREGGPVILIVVDALRPDHMTPYGASRNTTPHIDRLADEGLILTNYFVNGNWTRPTTATLLTGLPPVAHGVEQDQDRLASHFVTLAEALGKEGVPTGAVVGNGNAGSAFGLGRGFQYYADTTRYWDGLPSADQVVELAIPFVQQNRDKPFFLMMFFVDPHDPYHAPAPYEDMFVDDPSVPLIRSPHWERKKYAATEVERMKATYDGAIRYTDDTIGRFFDFLRQEGLYDQATIMVTADHGEAFGEHDVFLHAHHLYDELIRVPFVFKAPMMSRRGGYAHYLFQSLDLMPTLVRYFGGQVESGLGGVDIFAQLANPRLVDPKRVVVSEFNNFGISRRAIRTYRRKVIYQDPADENVFMATVGNRALLPSVSFDKPVVKFYDLKTDPGEHENLYSKARADHVDWRRLMRIAREYRKDVQKPLKPVAGADIDAETLKDLRALGYIQ